MTTSKNLQSMVKGLLLTIISWFAISTAVMAQTSQPQGGRNVSKTFKVCPFNVDGLPSTINILGIKININPDGLGEEGAAAIGQYIANSGIDILALSEDFNFHNSLVDNLGSDYTVATYRGGITADNFDLSKTNFNTDGLEFLTKKPYSFAQESWTPWNKTYGYTSNGSDELIKKGFRHYVVDLGDGAFVDFYIMHMDADTDPKDNEARASQWEQLRDAILANHNNRPIIVMGDTNSRYTRDDILGLFTNPIEEAGNYEVKDAWVKHCKSGVYPTLGSDPLMVGDLGYRQGEVVDKVLYLNPKKDGLNINSLAFDVDADFDKSDHKPIIVTMRVEGSAYAPAEANNWWRGEELQGNGQAVYIYNVGAGTFIAGQTATIKNIDDAYIWNINGNSPYTFACTNDTKDRIQMTRIGLTWTASIKEGSGASDFNVILSNYTTDRGKAYKLSVKKGGDTRYFNVEGTGYSAAKTAQSNLNDWLFISEEQKKAYSDYCELFNKAKNYQKYNLTEELKNELTTALNEAEKGSYESYEKDTEELQKAIDDIDAYLKYIATGIDTPSAAKTAKIVSIYGINGVRRSNLAKGINIVKMNDGSTRKVIVK